MLLVKTIRTPQLWPDCQKHRGRDLKVLRGMHLPMYARGQTSHSQHKLVLIRQYHMKDAAIRMPCCPAWHCCKLPEVIKSLLIQPGCSMHEPFLGRQVPRREHYHHPHLHSRRPNQLVKQQQPLKVPG